MSKYTELKSKHQAEVDAFPLGFAFNQKQFDEMMIKWDLKPTDIREILSIGGGGYVRRSDADAFKAMMGRHRIEMKMAMKKNEDDFLFHMFNYELANHEYGYTGELDDTLDALGLTAKEIVEDYQMLDALYRAIAKQCDGDVVYHIEQCIEDNEKEIERLKREKKQFEMRLRAIAAQDGC